MTPLINFTILHAMSSLAVCIDYDDPLIQSLILSSLHTYIPHLNPVPASLASLQWSTYESLSFEHILSNPSTTLCNSYIFRKALIRKHFLSNTIQQWLSKHPENILAQIVPITYLLECDYAEYLDEALNESFELRDELEKNEEREGEGKKWFILKPSMADRGQGIRLFSSLEQLEEIFEEFEQLDDDDEEEDEGEEEKCDTGVIANQLRHFVVQEYVPNPLLLSTIRPGRKFHLRAYVVAFGAIKVFVWSEILSLFAAQPYSPPSESADMDGHLTNTCLQAEDDKNNNVLRFWDLPLCKDELTGIFRKVCLVTGEVFMAAAQGQQMHFQVVSLEIRLI